MVLQRWPLFTKENRSGRHLPGEDSVDYPFLTLALILLTVGLVMLYSASYAQSLYDTGYTSSTRYLVRQGICAVLGLGAMGLLSRIPAAFWLRMSFRICALSVMVEPSLAMTMPAGVSCPILA